MMSTPADSYMLPHVERIKTLAGNRIASVARQDDDYTEITFRSNPSDDYEFKAFVYEDERMLEITAHRQELPGTLWSRPFERAGFANEDDQWTAFARILSKFFDGKSRIEVHAGRVLVDVVCFVEDYEPAVWVAACLSFSKQGRQLSALSNKTWRSGPIPPASAAP